MSGKTLVKRKFKDNERYAIYTVHGEKCYLCSKPIDLQSMQVDHIIPESLETDRAGLQSALESHGLPSNFDLNSYENWLPSCEPCNRKKLSVIFIPTPIIQAYIQRASMKAGDVKNLATKILSDRQISLALNKVLQANAADQLTDEQSTALQELVVYLLICIQNCTTKVPCLHPILPLVAPRCQ